MTVAVCFESILTAFMNLFACARLQKYCRSMHSAFLALLVVSSALAIWPAAIRAQQEAAIGGAGIGLKPTEDGRIIIERVTPDGPAAKAGIQPGDWLINVDQRAVSELNGSQLVDAIRGPVGSKVALVYVRGNAAPVSATVIRAALASSPAQPPPQSSNPTQPSAPIAKPAKGAMRFTRQTIMAPAANNVSAVTFLLPHGWQYQGQIVWMHEFSILANLRLRL